MNTTELPNEEDDLLLAEYALGVLEQVDRQRLESRLAQQPALRERLEQWHEHLAPMLQDIPAQSPPEYVWNRTCQPRAGPQLTPGQVSGTACCCGAGALWVAWRRPC